MPATVDANTDDPAVFRPVPVGAVLDRVLADDPERLALVAPGGSLTYGELDAAANAAAEALRDLGVAPGDRVAACLLNDLDIVVAFHGAMRRGAIWVGINAPLAPPEKAALLGAAAPALVLGGADLAADHGDRWRVLEAGPAGEWNEAVAAARGASRPPLPDPDAPAAIAYTSGTTGEPKGIVHSQRNLLLPGAAIVASRGYGPSLRKGDCLPLTILNLQVLTTLLTAAAGGCCILTDRRDARGVAEWIEANRVTVWNGVPTLLHGMVHDDELAPAGLASLVEVWTGGAPCPEDLLQRFQDRFGVPVRQTYGLTEAPTVVTIDPIGEPHVPHASGVPLPHLAVEIHDHAGAMVAPGDRGEVVVRGVADGPWVGAYTPMLGQWRSGATEPDESADGLRTGDIGSLDDHGRLFVHDRKKLVIVRGGANVYPAEVERVLVTAPGVRAGAALGLDDERLGQRVVAVVEVDPDTFGSVDDVVAHCRAHLARYKVPDEVRVVEALPRNSMGKVVRAPLPELFA